MRIAVLGGTGVVGRHVVQAVRDRGDEPVVVARSTGVDVLTGNGLDTALDGVNVVIDATNITTWRRKPAIEFFATASKSIQAAGRRAGVRHLVVLSIVGVDRAPGLGYYQAKVEQERLALDGDIPATVVRATQFHEFPGQILQRTRRGPLAVVPRMRVQPVAASAVASVLAEVASQDASGRDTPEVAGPEQHELPDLAKRLLRHRHERAYVVPVRLPGATGRAQAGGTLLPEGATRIIGPTFEDWLQKLRPAGDPGV